MTNMATLSNFYAIYRRIDAPFVIVVYQKIILENSEQFKRTRSEVFHAGHVRRKKKQLKPVFSHTSHVNPSWTEFTKQDRSCAEQISFPSCLHLSRFIVLTSTKKLTKLVSDSHTRKRHHIQTLEFVFRLIPLADDQSHEEKRKNDTTSSIFKTNATQSSCYPGWFCAEST